MTSSPPDRQPEDDMEGGELFPGPTRTLTIIRHGQYIPSGPPDYDGPLTAQGREQASLAATRVAGLPISVIHCSTLQRARETAEILARHFPGVEVRLSPLLRECVPSVPPLIQQHLERTVPALDLAQGPI